MPKKSLSLLLGILLSLLTSCASVPDVPVCVEINPTKAWCTNTVSEKEFYIDDAHPYNGRSWWEQRVANIQVPAQSWAEIKDFMIKTCKKSNACAKYIATWEKKTSTVDAKTKPK